MISDRTNVLFHKRSFMEATEQIEYEIRLQLLFFHYSSWVSELSDDIKETKMYITQIQGQYGQGAGYMFCIEGKPPKGLIYFFPEYNEIYMKKGSYWTDLGKSKSKYAVLVQMLKRWHKLKK